MSRGVICRGTTLAANGMVIIAPLKPTTVMIAAARWRRRTATSSRTATAVAAVTMRGNRPMKFAASTGSPPGGAKRLDHLLQVIQNRRRGLQERLRVEA